MSLDLKQPTTAISDFDISAHHMAKGSSLASVSLKSYIGTTCLHLLCIKACSFWVLDYATRGQPLRMKQHYRSINEISGRSMIALLYPLRKVPRSGRYHLGTNHKMTLQRRVQQRIVLLVSINKWGDYWVWRQKRRIMSWAVFRARPIYIHFVFRAGLGKR